MTADEMAVRLNILGYTGPYGRLEPEESHYTYGGRCLLLRKGHPATGVFSVQIDAEVPDDGDNRVKLRYYPPKQPLNPNPDLMGPSAMFMIYDITEDYIDKIPEYEKLLIETGEKMFK